MVSLVNQSHQISAIAHPFAKHGQSFTLATRNRTQRHSMIERPILKQRERISLVERSMALTIRNMDFDLPDVVTQEASNVVNHEASNYEHAKSYSLRSNNMFMGNKKRRSSDRTYDKVVSQDLMQLNLTSQYQSNRSSLSERRASLLQRISLPVFNPNRSLLENKKPKKRSAEELRFILKRTLKLIRSLSRVCIAIRRYVVNTTDSRAMLDVQKFLSPRSNDSLMELQSEKEPGSIYFNKNLFNVDNIHAFPLWARQFCSLAPNDRPMDGLLKLQKYLRGIPIFSKFDDQARVEICRNVIYNRYDKLRIILNQGDNAEYFYILIAGIVLVNISTKDSNTGVEVTATYDQIGRHEAFGGNALIHGTRRTATIISQTFVEVLMIDYETFRKYCCEIVASAIKREEYFLKSHKVFKTWSKRNTKLISYDVKTKNYRPGQIIDNDLVNSKYLYFIMDGAVSMMYSRNDEREKKYLYSSLLKRTVGVLGGNQIHAPEPCNLSCVLTERYKKQQTRCFMISHGATVLYLSKERFRELAPKDFSTFQIESFPLLSDKDYENESKKALKWIEYRANCVTELPGLSKHKHFPLNTINKDKVTEVMSLTRSRVLRE